MKGVKCVYIPLDRDDMIRELEAGGTIPEVAARLGVSTSKLRITMRQHGIPRFKYGGTYHKKIDPVVARSVAAVCEAHGATTAGTWAGVSARHVARLARQQGVEARPSHEWHPIRSRRPDCACPMCADIPEPVDPTDLIEREVVKHRRRAAAALRAAVERATANPSPPVLGLAPDDPTWRAKAACRGVDTAIFYPEARRSNGGRPDDEAMRLPRLICASCPVRDTCEQTVSDTDAYGSVRAGRYISRGASRQARKEQAA